MAGPRKCGKSMIDEDNVKNLGDAFHEDYEDVSGSSRQSGFELGVLLREYAD